MQNPQCKNFWWNYNKNENCLPYLVNKEQNRSFLLFPLSDMQKLRAGKILSVEVYLSSSVMVQPCKSKHYKLVIASQYENNILGVFASIYLKIYCFIFLKIFLSLNICFGLHLILIKVTETNFYNKKCYNSETYLYYPYYLRFSLICLAFNTFFKP